jgi:hypothetical protein
LAGFKRSGSPTGAPVVNASRINRSTDAIQSKRFNAHTIMYKWAIVLPNLQLSTNPFLPHQRDIRHLAALKAFLGRAATLKTLCKILCSAYLRHWAKIAMQGSLVPKAMYKKHGSIFCQETMGIFD